MEAKIASKRDSHWNCMSPRFRSQKRDDIIDSSRCAPAVPCDDEKGVVRLRIVVSKQQLGQMLELMSGRSREAAGHAPPQPPSLEQLLHVLRRRHAKKGNMQMSHRSSWRPALQSIPEEL